MSQAQPFYERQAALTWWFVMARIGQDLRDEYEVSTELPPELIALVKKLAAAEGKPRSRTLMGIWDAIEGSYLSRHAPPLEPRSVDPSDGAWPLCT